MNEQENEKIKLYTSIERERGRKEKKRKEKKRKEKKRKERQESAEKKSERCNNISEINHYLLFHSTPFHFQYKMYSSFSISFHLILIVSHSIRPEKQSSNKLFRNFIRFFFFSAGV